jgi:hypothetical protein
VTVTDAQLKQLVDALAQWDGGRRIGAPEVIAWRTGKRGFGSVRLAFRGDPLRIKRNLLTGEHPLPNRPPRGQYVGELDLDMERALGLEMGQIFTTDDVYPYDFVAGVQTAADRFLEERLGVEDASEMVEVTLMPKQGEPWIVGTDVTSYVSSRRARPVKAKRPAHLIDLDMDAVEMQREDIDVPLGIDPCAFAERVDRCNVGALIGSLPDRRSSLDFLVTHSFDVTLPRYEDAAERIGACGGLAFPSLAVGEIAASNFGQVALVADVGLVLEGLKPYRGRGKWPVTVYATDAWTVRTRRVFTVGAHELFVELTGQPTNWTYKQDMWVLGPPLEDHKADVVMTTKKLRKELKERYRRWPRDLDNEQIEALMAEMLEQEGLGHRVAPAKYPYLEAKVNGIVPLTCFPVAVCPKELAGRAKAFLQTAGWKGVLAEVDFPSFAGEHFVRRGRDLRYDFGWAVRDVVQSLAEEERLIMDVQL